MLEAAKNSQITFDPPRMLTRRRVAEWDGKYKEL